MAVSVLPDVIDALVAQATTSLGSTAKVLDWYGPSDSSGNFLIVGTNDATELESEAGAVEQSWATTGQNAKRREEGDVNCVAIAHDGSSIKTARDAALTIFEAVASLVRADPTLGGISNLFWAECTTSRLVQKPAGNGYRCDAEFVVHYRAQI